MEEYKREEKESVQYQKNQWSLRANDCFNGYLWGELQPITNKCGFYQQ